MTPPQVSRKCGGGQHGLPYWQRHIQKDGGGDEAAACNRACVCMYVYVCVCVWGGGGLTHGQARGRSTV